MSQEELRKLGRLPWAEQVKLGVLGLAIPEAYGGAGLGFAELGLVLEEHGRRLAATPLLASGVLAAGALLLGDDDAARHAWLPAIASGERLVAFAHDEGPRHGDDVAARVEAGRAHGDKSFVLDAEGAAAYVVTARQGVFLVEREGAEVTPLALIDGRPVARVRFRGARVMAALGGSGLVRPTLARGAAALAAEMLGGMTEVFEKTLAYLKTRRQFGVPIGSFQALQHRAATLHCELELTRSLVLAALRAIDERAPEAGRLCAAAKARASDTFVLAAAEAVQLHGGIGVTDELDIGRYLKRARVAAETLGNAAHHRAAFLRYNWIMMSPADREDLRRHLEERARQILHNTHEQVAEATSAPEVRGDVLDSPEESLLDAMQTTRADLTDRDQHVLAAIRDALVRHRDGTYGVCIDCGEEIPLERLRAVPWAPRCADDQERFETQQRATSPTL